MSLFQNSTFYDQLINRRQIQYNLLVRETTKQPVESTHLIPVGDVTMSYTTVG